MQPDTSQLYLYIRVIDYELQGIPHFISFLFLVKPLEKSKLLFQQITGFFFSSYFVLLLYQRRELY